MFLKWNREITSVEMVGFTNQISVTNKCSCKFKRTGIPKIVEVYGVTKRVIYESIKKVFPTSIIVINLIWKKENRRGV